MNTTVETAASFVSKWNEYLTEIGFATVKTIDELFYDVELGIYPRICVHLKEEEGAPIRNPKIVDRIDWSTCRSVLGPTRGPTSLDELINIWRENYRLDIECSEGGGVPLKTSMTIDDLYFMWNLYMEIYHDRQVAEKNHTELVKAALAA